MDDDTVWLVSVWPGAQRAQDGVFFWAQLLLLGGVNVIKCYMKSSAKVSSPHSSWDVVITEWALSTYLQLKYAQVFTDGEYRTTLRPDVELLKDGLPSAHRRFSNPKFWGPAEDGTTHLKNGFKMKWHQVGPGKVQLRLCVMAGSGTVFLCEGYVKSSDAVDRRKQARFKTHMNLIAQGRYIHRGKL